MNKLLTIVFLIYLSYPTIASEKSTHPSNTIDYNIIRTAGALCGAGLSLEAQGEVNAKIARIFGGVEASGGGRIDLGQAKDLLEQFSENHIKASVYQTYTSCVIQAMNSITGMASENETVPVIDNLVIPDPLIIVKNGQKFAMEIGESRAIVDESIILTVNKIPNNPNHTHHVYYSFNDSKNNVTKRNQYVYQTNPIVFYKGCQVNPYLIDPNKKVSFIVQCK